MDAKEWDKRLSRLLRLLEQMAAAGSQQPVVNVNVHVGGEQEGAGDDGAEDAVEGRLRRRAVSSSTSNDVPKPGGMPRPYVS